MGDMTCSACSSLGQYAAYQVNDPSLGSLSDTFRKLGSPLPKLVDAIKQRQAPVSGIGGADQIVSLGVVLAVAAAVVGLYGAAGWYAGKAMAPSKSAESTYKWTGAVGNVLLPGIAVGVLGAMSLSNKG
jgi:hypothetical protein